MKIEILHRYTRTVLYHAESENLKTATIAAVKSSADLEGADLGNTYLEGADLRDADLRGADLGNTYLKGADLRGAYLKGAYLKGADLKDADLKGAYLKGAYLRGADLKGADLKGADFEGADLKGADLRGAYLRDADFEGADLKGADLRGADLGSAYLRGAYLGTQWVIQGGTRQDGHQFNLTNLTDEGIRLKAGCRNFTITEARAHWIKTRGGTPLGDESLALIDGLLAQARIRGYNVEEK